MESHILDVLADRVLELGPNRETPVRIVISS